MNLPEKLEGDVFEIKDLIKVMQERKPHSLTGSQYELELPAELKEAVERAQVLALKHDIPLFWVASLPKGMMMRYELGTHPENVSVPFMMARASASLDEKYMQNLFMKLSMYIHP